jgi:hypothetical protein
MFVSGELNSTVSAAEGLKNSVKQAGQAKAAGPALEVKLSEKTMQQRLREQIIAMRTEGKAINSAMSIAQKAAKAGTLGEKLEGLAKLKNQLAGDLMMDAKEYLEKRLEEAGGIINSRQISFENISHDGGAVDISVAEGATIKITASDFGTKNVNMKIGENENGALASLYNLNEQIGQFLEETSGGLAGKLKGINSKIEGIMGGNKLKGNQIGDVTKKTAAQIASAGQKNLIDQATNIITRIAMENIKL